MRKKTVRSDAELAAASQHLAYEVEMLTAVASLLDGSAHSPTILRNALLESFTVHARALLQFFYPTNPHAGDVLSDHYFDDVILWRRTLGRQPKRLAQISERVATEIVHLTYTRLEVLPEARNWSITEISKAILGLVATFRATAPPLRLAEPWTGATFVFSEAAPTATNAVTAVNSPSANAMFSASPEADDSGIT
jgi:hypothetical protein